jgi:nitroreductase
MHITFEDIKKRKSVRTYEDRLLDPAVKAEFTSFIATNKTGPFGTTVTIQMIDLTGAGQDELKQLASYGNIRGPKYFMAGAIKSSPQAVLDYGYLMEMNILAAAALGLGTCWVGGTFSRAGFLEKINAKPEEVVAAVVPMGYAAKHKDTADAATRLFVQADTRKPWKEIFFDTEPDKPLSESRAGVIARSLEALRLAPSASNKQPWRVIKDGERLHIFLERTPGYWRAPLEDIQLMDIGIAMCNFDASAHESGIRGKWIDRDKYPGKDGWECIASWERII